MKKEERERVVKMVSSDDEEIRDLGITMLMNVYRYSEWYVIPQTAHLSFFALIKKIYNKDKVGGIILHKDNLYSIFSPDLFKKCYYIFKEYPIVNV